MKKQNLINLVKYYSEKNDEAFIAEAAQIAKEFDQAGDTVTSQYLLELISNTNYYVPQLKYKNFRFIQKKSYSKNPLFLPDVIEEDITGIIRAIANKTGLSKFLFYGPSGSGKSESAYQIARILNRDILSVSFEQLIGASVNETVKNIALMFEEIQHLPYNSALVLLDETDTLLFNGANKNDLNQMNLILVALRKGMDSLNENIVVIAIFNQLDVGNEGLIKKFDLLVSFDRYTKEELIEIAGLIFADVMQQSEPLKKDMRLFHKILENVEEIPYPGKIKEIVQTSIALSNASVEGDYLRKIYVALGDNQTTADFQKLSREGFTTREIAVLTGSSKSSVSRKLLATKP